MYQPSTEMNFFEFTLALTVSGVISYLSVAYLLGSLKNLERIDYEEVMQLEYEREMEILNQRFETEDGGYESESEEHIQENTQDLPLQVKRVAWKKINRGELIPQELLIVPDEISDSDLFDFIML